MAHFNHTQDAPPTDVSLDICLHELFEQQVKRTPAARAVILQDLVLTYAELNHCVGYLAYQLWLQGVRTETRVGVFIERSLSSLIAFLAILKAGGTYVPLDPTYPSGHLAYILEDSQVAVLLTRQQLVAQLPPHHASIVCLDDLLTRAREIEPADLSSDVTPTNLLFVMYTSGSTGQPKGVAVEQRQILNRLRWAWRAFPFEPGEVLCQRTTLNFTVSLWELLGGLLHGIPTVIIPENIAADIPALISELSRQQVTRIVLVPSLLKAILATDGDLASALICLKNWVVCGDILSSDLCQRFRERLPSARLINQYGASEVNDVLYCDTSQMTPEREHVPLGRPIDNIQIYLLDQHLQPVPVGVPGEVYVASPSLARGYVNRPDLTAERFIPHPFSTQPGARLFAMRDIARYLPDGRIEYLGRQDHLVKIHGIRVELSGIETVLAQHPALSECVVMAREDTPGEKRLVAYIVLSPGQEVTDSQLQHFLRERFPRTMIPAVFVRLDKLPLTPNGKIHRYALPAPGGARPILDVAYRDPQTHIEQTLAAIWQEYLHVESIGLYDNFFDLGGTSLIAQEVLRQVHARMQYTLSVVDLFQYPTIATLAQHLTSTGEAAPFLPDAPSGQIAARKAFFRQQAAQRQRNRLVNDK
jgi:amino acid adenylation domain-containing protein